VFLRNDSLLARNVTNFASRNRGSPIAVNPRADAILDALEHMKG
jgi:hypothetical protein